MELVLSGPDWTHVDGVAVAGTAFDGKRALTGQTLANRFRAARSPAEPLEAITDYAASLEGFYAAVVPVDSGVVLLADGARSIPLYYDDGIVSDRGWVVREAVGADVDPLTECEFLCTRYVTGAETIWHGVHSTQPGAAVFLTEDGIITEKRYRDSWLHAETEVGATTNALIDRLEAALDTALNRLETVAGDRPVVVPLSGGYDSRLVASALVERGREVIAYTFGRPGHPDVEVSRAVAAHLGIRWELFPYDDSSWREWYHGERCQRYLEETFSGDALPFLAEWPALSALVERGRLPSTALFCPGHTVATPSERLPSFVGEAESDSRGVVGCGVAAAGEHPTIEPSASALVDYILGRHYTLWECELPDALSAGIRQRIRDGLFGDWPNFGTMDPETAAGSYERWEWRGRMSTFTNGDLRAYESVGVDWWLPLWDPAYVRAWQSIPFAQRRNKALHAELAVRTYRRVAGLSRSKAVVTDRTLSPADRLLSPVRYTPAALWTEGEARDWEPSFLTPQSAWDEPGQHPLAWFGAVDDTVLERFPARSFYALRTLAALDRLDLTGSAPVELPPYVASKTGE